MVKILFSFRSLRVPKSGKALKKRLKLEHHRVDDLEKDFPLNNGARVYMSRFLDKPNAELRRSRPSVRSYTIPKIDSDLSLVSNEEMKFETKDSRNHPRLIPM
jgi:hypothetical protein